MKFNIIATFLATFFAPMFAFASQQGHWYEMFKANVQHVLGEHPAHSILSGMTRSEAGGGEGVWLNAIDAKESADAGGFSEIEGAGTNFTDLPSVKKFQQADGDFDAYKTTLTPFNDVVKYKTYSEPQVNEWGHSFQASEDTWQNLTDPKSTVISVGMQKMHRRTDILMAKAVTAPTVGRRIDGGALADVAIADLGTQILGDQTYASANVDTIPTLINETMGNAWFTRGMPIYCAISTKLATAMKTNSEQGDKLRSRDFIASYDQFRNGVIPTVEGVTFIEFPKEFMEAIKAPEGATSGDQTDHYFAWSPQAIAKVDYQALGTQIGVDPNRRFYTAAYVSEYVDYKRTDDLGVVMGDIVVP